MSKLESEMDLQLESCHLLENMDQVTQMFLFFFFIIFELYQ